MSIEPTLSWYLALAPEISLAILLVAIQIYSRTLAFNNQRNVGLMTAWGAGIILLGTVGLWLLGGEPNAATSFPESLIWGGMIRHDLITLVFRVIFLSALVTTSLISLDVKKLQTIEYYALLIMATMGFSLMGASADLIMLYIGLEMASISSYVLAGFAKTEDRSPEAGMKYFVYGAFATGLMLYGMSLVYGLTGQTNLYVIGSRVVGIPTAEIAKAQNDLALLADVQNINAVLLIAAAMIIVGFGFKISAVPFHFWTPDVYEGSPTPFTAFVSTASKAAGFAVFMRVFTSGMLNFIPSSTGQPGQGTAWWPMLVSMCIITMTIGNFAAIYQRNIKRLLAYSSVAQAGYAMIGLVTLTPDGSGATMFYLLMYVFTNVAAFGVIIVISNVSKSEQMEDLYGLNKRSPYLALVMLFALLSLGGIPPTAGFLGKFFIFKAAVDAGYWWLALIGILNAFVALYYYLNVIKYMYLYDSEQQDVSIPVSRGAWVGLGLSTAVIIYLGVYAGPTFELTREAAVSFFSLVGFGG
ncbi:NADH-quinone oxidoreductase subunit N [Candidatus Leptofilum sp.]|uniref:NADH-quinone oxidoreductase subunit N n=1 Tax=Candidatus Leptofilum sp. TaxID=3241576 RepID=UPI003B59AB7B